MRHIFPFTLEQLGDGKHRVPAAFTDRRCNAPKYPPWPHSAKKVSHLSRPSHLSHKKCLICLHRLIRSCYCSYMVSCLVRKSNQEINGSVEEGHSDRLSKQDHLDHKLLGRASALLRSEHRERHCSAPKKS